MENIISCAPVARNHRHTIQKVERNPMEFPTFDQVRTVAIVYSVIVATGALLYTRKGYQLKRQEHKRLEPTCDIEAYNIQRHADWHDISLTIRNRSDEPISILEVKCKGCLQIALREWCRNPKTLEYNPKYGVEYLEKSNIDTVDLDITVPPREQGAAAPSQVIDFYIRHEKGHQLRDLELEIKFSLSSRSKSSVRFKYHKLIV